MSPIECLALVALLATVAAVVHLVAESAARRRTALAVAAGSLAVLSLAGCSSSSSAEATPTPSSSAAGPSNAAAQATCTSESLLSALPGGADMVKFNCADAGGQEWAATTVNPGNTVFFLRWNGNAWDAMTSGDVCGTASAGLPDQLLSYCKA